MPAAHEDQVFDAGRQARQRSHRLRPLQGQQGLLGQGLHRAARTYAGLDVGDVRHLAGAVDDDEDVVLALKEHQVVEDAAFVVQQQAVALLAHRQVDHVDRHQALECGGGVTAGQAQLAHVRHVEQAGGLACAQVLGHQAAGVLHRHAVASERDHARTQFQVQRMQRGFQQIGGIGHAGLQVDHAGGLPPWEPCCPGYLRDSPLHREVSACPFGGPARGVGLSPTESIRQQSWIPERSAFGGFRGENSLLLAVRV